MRPQWNIFSCHRCRMVTVCPETHWHAKQRSFLSPQAILLPPSHSHTQLHLLLGVSQPMPDHSLSNWQIWNNKTAAETTTTRCLCHPSLHANFDKPDTLGTANCLPQCYRRPSFYGGPLRWFFFKLLVSPLWQPCLWILLIELASGTLNFNPPSLQRILHCIISCNKWSILLTLLNEACTEKDSFVCLSVCVS